MITEFDLSEMTVLIVDDTSLMRAQHQKMLTGLGLKPENMFYAENGQMALTTLAQQLKEGRRIHLIVCDWDMPKVSGLQVLQMVKSLASTKTIPFLMVTGHAERDDILTAMKAGANSYVVKPFKEENFRDKVVEVLAQGFVAGA